jgi:hypothetical protein
MGCWWARRRRPRRAGVLGDRRGTELAQWQYVAVVVGLLTGTGVALGARKPSLGGSIIAVVLSTLATLVAVYFISRSLAIIAADDSRHHHRHPAVVGLERRARRGDGLGRR